MLRKFKESVIEVLTVGHILLKRENGKLPEADGLVNNSAENLGVVKGSGGQTTLVGRRRVNRLVYLRPFEHSCLNGIWLQVDIEIPFLDLLGLSNGSVKVLDRPDSLRRLLKQALSYLCHYLLVFSYLGWDSHEGAKLRWQIDILSLLTDFEKRLIDCFDFYTICSFKVVNHICTSFFITMVEDVIFGVHVPFDLMDFVGTMRAVLSHYYSSFEFSGHKLSIMP